MGNVISIAVVRAERMRQTLAIHARNGETVIIDVAIGPVLAERIICRDGFAEVLNSVGEYCVVNYGDIRAIRPASVAQTGVFNTRGEFSLSHKPAAFHKPAASAQTIAVLPFRRRRSQ